MYNKILINEGNQNCHFNFRILLHNSYKKKRLDFMIPTQLACIKELATLYYYFII